ARPPRRARLRAPPRPRRRRHRLRLGLTRHGPAETGGPAGPASSLTRGDLLGCRFRSGELEPRVVASARSTVEVLPFHDRRPFLPPTLARGVAAGARDRLGAAA